MNEFSFRYCPVCSRLLECGHLMLTDGRSVKKYVWWHSENKIIIKRFDECVGLFRTIPTEYDRKNFNKLNIPAGYCKKCDRIFVEFESGE